MSWAQKTSLDTFKKDLHYSLTTVKKGEEKPIEE